MGYAIFIKPSLSNNNTIVYVKSKQSKNNRDEKIRTVRGLHEEPRHTSGTPRSMSSIS